MASFDTTLTPVLAGPPSGLSAENLQSRIRGTLLMAVANQQGQLLLSTGNKSELAVGYCTLYGDMNGGLAVIGDLYKSSVFELCAWLDSAAAGPCRCRICRWIRWPSCLRRGGAGTERSTANSGPFGASTEYQHAECLREHPGQTDARIVSRRTQFQRGYQRDRVAGNALRRKFIRRRRRRPT